MPINFDRPCLTKENVWDMKMKLQTKCSNFYFGHQLYIAIKISLKLVEIKNWNQMKRQEPLIHKYNCQTIFIAIFRQIFHTKFFCRPCLTKENVRDMNQNGKPHLHCCKLNPVNIFMHIWKMPVFRISIRYVGIFSRQALDISDFLKVDITPFFSKSVQRYFALG